MIEEWAQVALFDPANDFRHLDGNYDAFIDRDELLTRTDWRQRIAKHLLPGFDLDGDGKLSLTEYRLTPLACPVNLCWSPDGKQICFKAGRPDGKFDIALVAAAGAERGLKVRYTGTSFNPKFAWHPTENRIVFAMHCPERRSLQLYQFDPTADEAPVLVPGQDPRSDNGDPCWTPDGKRLIVTCGNY